MTQIALLWSTVRIPDVSREWLDKENTTRSVIHPKLKNGTPTHFITKTLNVIWKICKILCSRVMLLAYTKDAANYRANANKSWSI